MSDLLGQQVGKYRLIRQLGEGGQAPVYLGEHLNLGKQAAVKVLDNLLQNENIEKFKAEARLIASLRHPHILQVFDFGVDYRIGKAYLVMEYAPGGSVCQPHCKGVPLPLDLIIHYVKQVADALQYIHNQRYTDGRRLIHRDVKPANMLLGYNNEILLCDFGIALLAHTTNPSKVQGRAGTPPYMAPEQIQGKPRRASDQYALGIVVYEWLTGTYPFKGTAFEILCKHINVSPPPLCEIISSLSPDVEYVVLKALAKDPKERFANVQEFAIALEQAHLSSKRVIEGIGYDRS